MQQVSLATILSKLYNNQSPSRRPKIQFPKNQVWYFKYIFKFYLSKIVHYEILMTIFMILTNVAGLGFEVFCLRSCCCENTRIDQLAQGGGEGGFDRGVHEITDESSSNEATSLRMRV